MKLRLRRPRPAHVGYDPLPYRPSGGQLTALVVGLAAALLLAPVGAQATAKLANVVITDPADPARQAHVDATGNLRVAGSVDLANTPLAVTSSDDPGRLAFQQDLDLHMSPGVGGTAKSIFDVPTGKRLVIRYVSIGALLPHGQRLPLAALSTVVGGHQVHYDFVPVFTGPDITGDRFVAAQDTQLYADPETTVWLQVSRTAGTGYATVYVAVSGYFIDCAAAACS